MTASRMTARQVTRALYWHFAGRWAFLTEVTARPDRGKRLSDSNTSRRIDVLLLKTNANMAGGIERLAIEVRVTRADFWQDVRNPNKQAPWRELAHRHAYAVPEGLVAASEVPATSGVLVVKPVTWATDRYDVGWARRAQRPAGHDPGPLPLQNVMDAFWRASRAEAQAKGLSGDVGDTGEETAEQLRAELQRVRHELDVAHNRISREVEAKQRWQHAFGAVGAPPCGTCGRPLRPCRRHHFEWEHRDRTDAAICELIRRAAAEAEDQARPQRDRMGRYVFVHPPEPADVPATPALERQSTRGGLHAR